MRLLFRSLRCVCLWNAVNAVFGFTASTTVRDAQRSIHARPFLRKEARIASNQDHASLMPSIGSVQSACLPKLHAGHFSLRMTTSSEDAVSSPSLLATTEKKVQVQRTYSTFYWRYKGKSYNINYRVSGPIDAPPLLLVHGFGANVNHFRFQFSNAELTGSHRVYALDLLGFGASDKPGDADYSIELFAQLVSDFIQAMHGENQDQAPPAPWVLCGNSIGGLTCLCVAEKLPSLVRGVVLFNCAGGMTGFRYEDVPAWARPILYFVQNVVLGPFWGGRFFANFKTRDNVESILKTQGVYGDTRNVDEELIDILLGPSDDKGAEQVFLRVFAGPPGPTPESILPTIRCPVLAIWGGSDPVR
jgi:pimeloyl-ACP methyl ester carboxylesterase